MSQAGDRPGGRLRRRTSAVCLCLLALAPYSRGIAADDVPAEAFARLEHGLTPDEVRQRVGPPRRVARQLLYHRYVEQWVYDQPAPARLVFDCPRGQKPQLVGKHLPPARK